MNRILILLTLILTCKSTKELDFVEGLLLGIKEEANPKLLSNCLKEYTIDFTELNKALNYIRTKQVSNMLSGIKTYIKTFKTIINVVKPCWKGFDRLRTLDYALISAEPFRTVLNILNDIHLYIPIVDNALRTLKEESYNEAGKQLGVFASNLFAIPVDNIRHSKELTGSSNESINTSTEKLDTTIFNNIISTFSRIYLANPLNFLLNQNLYNNIEFKIARTTITKALIKLRASSLHFIERIANILKEIVPEIN